MKKKNVLYITYDGISDHIGQSQVAPYLIGLAKKGHRITILSAEKKDKSELIEKYKTLFLKYGIDWHYIPYHQKPPVFSTLWDVWQLQRIAKNLVKKNKIQVIHCRSYVSSLVGLSLKKKYGTRFIFDMRDFWPDARKEVKSFDIENNPLHKKVYNFFKKKEKEFLENADYIISLTEAGKRIMEQWKTEGMKINAPIAVIPCCADFDFFDPGRLKEDKVQNLRHSLGISEGDFVLNYLGSLGPAYLTNEVLDFYKILLQVKPAAKFLIAANNDHHLVREAAEHKGIDPAKLIITKGGKDDIPYLIALCDLSVFFIMPSFAKQACSPTKLAELFAMNVPVIANTNVGDLDKLLNLERNNSAVIKAFDDNEYERVLEQVLIRIRQGNSHIRENMKNYLSVEHGIGLYDEVYQGLQKDII